jgi:hypothetical protein
MAVVAIPSSNLINLTASSASTSSARGLRGNCVPVPQLCHHTSTTTRPNQNKKYNQISKKKRGGDRERDIPATTPEESRCPPTPTIMMTMTMVVMVPFRRATAVTCAQVLTAADAKHLRHIALPADIVQTHSGVGGAYGAALGRVELLF